MSLKALASQTLARLHGTELGTPMEQLEHTVACSSPTLACSTHLEHKFPQKLANNEACSTVPLSRDGTGGTLLPEELALGLKRLRLMPAPRITDPSAWPEIISDATRIADEGWAARAIGLGWSALDLFGCSIDGEYEALAVWLRTRRIILIDERSAITVANDGRRHVFNRRDHEGAILLWELGGD